MNKKEYAEYEEKFKSFMDENGLDNLSIKQGEDEPYFTWRKCDVCGAEAGSRYLCNGYISSKREIMDNIEACEDCVYYAEYGQLDDMTMLEIERSEE